MHRLRRHLILNGVLRKCFFYNYATVSSAAEHQSLPLDVATPSSSSANVPSSILNHPDYFGVRSLYSMNDLFKANVHLGHKVGTLHDHMKRHLFGTRLDLCIIDLEQTVEYLFRALNFLAHIAYREGIVLFVTNDRMNRPQFESTARRCKEFAHTRAWDLSTFLSSETRFGTEIRYPDVVVLVSIQDSNFAQHEAVREAAKLLIPTVAVVDSNVDPNYVTYPVPGNDDSMSAVALFLRLFGDAILLGKERLKQDQLKEGGGE